MRKTCLKTAYFLLGIIVFTVILLLDIPGLSHDGKTCLSICLMTVVWWATKAINNNYAALIATVSFYLLYSKEKVSLTQLFPLWNSPILYLIVGGFLMAYAIESSSLAKRVSNFLIKHMVHSYSSLLLLCYLASLILSFIIPQPWPRAFLLLAIIMQIAKQSGLSALQRQSLAFSAFMSNIPTSLLLLTGDSSINAMIANSNYASFTWLSWLLYMGPIAGLSLCFTYIGQKYLFRGIPDTPISPTCSELPKKLNSSEIFCLIAILSAIFLWSTDNLHGIHPGIIMIGAILFLALPFTHVLDGSAFSKIDIGLLFFLNTTMSIGAIGETTGMNSWFARVFSILPQANSPVIFALVGCFTCMALHMLLGGVIISITVALPILVSYASYCGYPVETAVFLTYFSIANHFLLPYHHTTILIGVGSGEEQYPQSFVLKMALSQTISTVLLSIIGVLWWNFVFNHL